MTVAISRPCGAAALSLPMPVIHCTSICSGVGVVEVLAVGQLTRAERVDEDVPLVPVDLRMRVVQFLFHAHGGATLALFRADLVDVERPLQRPELGEPEVHQHRACRR